MAHALPTLFYTEWDDALMVTADGGGDNVNHSHRRFANGKMHNIYGGDEWLLRDNPIDSLGQAYAAATRALGFRDNRHEGKLRACQPWESQFSRSESVAIFVSTMLAEFFPISATNAAIFKLLAKIAKEGRREDVAASIRRCWRTRCCCR